MSHAPRRPTRYAAHLCSRACAAAATAALLIADQRLSVTIDLHTTCVSAAPLGSMLEIESVVEASGKSVLFSSCNIYTVGDTGERRLVTMGMHTKKVVGGSLPPSKL